MFRTTDALPVLDARAVAAIGDESWVATSAGLFVRTAPKTPFRPVPLPEGCGDVADVAAGRGVLGVSGALVACGTRFLEVLPSGEVLAGPWDAPLPVSHVFACAGVAYAVGGGLLVAGETGVFAGPEGVVILDGTCAGGEPWVSSGDGLWSWSDGAWRLEWTPESPVTALAGADDVRDGSGSAFAAAGDEVARVAPGLGVIASWRAAPGGLPTAPATSLAAAGGFLAVGHPIGVSLLHPETGSVEHFHSLRWLPAEEARDVSLSAGGDLWVATPGGLARLHRDATALADKADRMFEALDRWHWRMDGFVTAGAVFPDPWSEGPASRWDDDNDGQWTEEAVAAFCYAFAVTGDPRYREAARRAVDNMLLLIDVPAADFEAAGLGRGFVTRSLVRDDEGPVFESKASQSNWHLVHHSDGRDYYWKDDTSSDEVTGHFFGLSVYHDLCATDDLERARVAKGITDLAGYLLDHGFTLPDLDGKPTTHGDWSPAKISIAVDGVETCIDLGHDIVDCVGAWAGGGFLDSLEILGGMLAAWHASGEDRFLQAYETLITEYRYGEVATFSDHVLTWTNPGVANYCDHELADLAFLTLLRYEPRPERRERWIGSLLAAWEYEEGERNPLKVLAMASAVHDVPGLDDGVRTLVEYPEDLRDVLVDNAHRRDAARGVPDRFGEPQFTTVFPYDEIQTMRWDHNPYRVRDGGDGRMRMSPAFWLLPYWGLRYYNAICEAGPAR